MKNAAKILIVAVLVLSAVAVFAQTNYEVKRGTVISTYGDKLVVKMSTGEVKEVTVPAGFKFQVDGKDMTLDQLQPGMELTATIKTTTKPETVKTVSIKNGEVLKVHDTQMWVKQDGKIKTYSVPAGFKFDMDGRKVSVKELTPGTKLTAEIVYTSEKMVTEKEYAISGATPTPAPAPEPAPAVAAAPAAEPAPAAAPAELPKTASNMPLVALLGASLLAAGVALRARS